LDIRTDYREDGSVALMTKTGFGLLDEGPTVFEFHPAGSLDAGAQFSFDDNENGVGTLMALTSSGLQIDAVEQGLVQSGRMGALFQMRDETLVDLQAQVDEIAAGLAQSLSTVETAGTAVVGPPDGFSLDLANVQPGNDFTVSYSVNGTEHNVRVVRVDDPTKLPMDETGPNGERVIGLDFSGGIGAVATALDTALGPAISVSNPAGTTLEIVDDGVAGTSDINSLASRTTVTGNQGNGLAFSLFVDGGNASFTNSLDGDPQKVGFAGRIAVNTAVITDNTLLEQYDASASMGESDRPNFLLSQLENMEFISNNVTSLETGSFRLSGNAQDMIGQMLTFQGTSIAGASSDKSVKEYAFNAVESRMTDEYGVNVDEEMARLMELQNSYAASARVVSVVQELIDTLMRI
jgi:flagellar hook-associated protein 1 FlgK